MIRLIAIVLIFMSSFLPAGRAEEPKKKSLPARQDELVLTGKLYCPLKRYVAIPYHGILTEVDIESGQKLSAGDIIGRYRLAPEVSLDLHRRLIDLDSRDIELKIVELSGRLTALDRKKKEIETLVKSKMAPKETLKQLNLERQSLIGQRNLLHNRMKIQRDLHKKDRAAIESRLGLEVKPGGMPVEGVLKAPIDGYVIFIHPEVRVGAELPPQSRILEVGIMDPMTLRVLVHQMELAGIERGDKAGFILESMPDRRFQAAVSRISWTPADKQLEHPSYFELEFLAPNPDLILKEGFRGKVYLTPEKRP